MSRPLRIVVADDCPVVVSGVAALLSPYRRRVSVVDLDHDGARADVILYDRADTMAGLLRTLLVADDISVVMFTRFLTAPMTTWALDHGAAGWLPKTSDGRQLLEGIEALHAGRSIVPAATGEQLWPGHGVGLSARESEVLSYVTRGLTNPEIADTLHISVNSIKSHIRAAYRKMGVTRRSAAVTWGIQRGFPVADDEYDLDGVGR